MTGIAPIEMKPAVYRVKTWRRIFLWLAGPSFLISCLGLLMMASHAAAGQALLAFSFAILVSVPGFFMIASAIRPRIILNATGIEVRGVFTTRCAARSEIEGLRTTGSRYGSYKELILKDGRKSMAIRSRFRTDADFRAWFQGFPDLDRRDREALLARIAQSLELGSTPEQRLGALARAKQYNIALMAIAVAAALCLNLAAPRWNGLSAVVLALIPLFTAWLCWRSPLLYTAFRRKQDPRAETIHALLIAALGMVFHLAPFHLLSLWPLMGGMVLLGLFTLAAYTRIVRSSSRKKALVAVLFLTALYAYGTMTTLDVCFDSSRGQRDLAAVVGKHITRGRSTSYYLRLAPWGPVSAPEDVSVSIPLYRATAVGDTVCLDLHPGRLNAAWFRVSTCSALGTSNPPAPAH